MALFNNIIHRLRFPKFMTTVSKEVDNHGSVLLEGLLQHGRLTLTQSLERAVDCSAAGSNISRDIYRESFRKLVNRRFVERCPAPEPSIPTEETPAKKGVGRSAKIAMKEVTLEERALMAAIPMDAERFSLVTDPGVDSDEDKSGGDSPSAKVGEKWKQDSLQLDSEHDSMRSNKEPVWRVNFDEFINHLRKKACVEYARAEYDNATALILNCMLEGTKRTETTVTLSLESIFEEVIKTEEGRSMNLDRVRCSLEELHFCSEDDDLFSVKLTDIIKQAQLEEVESIVLKRYGRNAFKIFRWLSNGRQLDTDKISEKSFVDKKDTPKILYRLWKDNCVQMEKITTGGPKQTDVFLWRVKKDALWDQVLDELYHATLNLLLRNAFEMEQEREVINLPRYKLVGDMEKRIKRVRNVRDLLHSSIMKLDDAIMLFHDFL